MKKRKQHYVWQHYLKAWAVDGQLWCQRQGTCFPTSTANVANRRDFYRLKEMSLRDLDFVRLLISAMDEHAREMAKGWITHFTLFHRLQKEICSRAQTNTLLEECIDETLNNLEEDMHADAERKVIPILQALRDGHADCLREDEQFVAFARFIGLQYMRTPRMLRRACESLANVTPFNVEAAWGLLRTIFATNIGGQLFLRRRTLRLVLLEAPTGGEFVTADQPIINTRAVSDGPPTELEFYYPLSPVRALLIDCEQVDGATERRALAVQDLQKLNRMMASHADEQLYASSQNVLAQL